MSTPNQSGFNFFNINQGAVPVEATYGRTAHTDEHVKHKELIKKFPDNTSPAQPGSVVRYHIANSGKMLDPKSIVWYFDITIPVGAGTHAMFQGSAHSLIQSIEIRLNNTDLIERVENYNILRGNLHNFLAPGTHQYVNHSIVDRLDGSCVGRYSSVREARNTHLAYDDLIDGVAGNADENTALVTSAEESKVTNHWIAYGADSTAKLALRFDLLGFLNQNKFIPMDAIRSLDIEITLAAVEKVFAPYFTTVGTSTYPVSYTVSNQYLTMDMYDFSIPYRAALNEAMMESGLFFEMDTYVDYAPSISQGSGEIILRRDFSSLKGIYLVIQRPKEYTGSGAVGAASIHPTETQHSDISKLAEYQIFIDNRPISAQPIKVGSHEQSSEQLFETLKSLRLHGDLQYLPGAFIPSGSSKRLLSKYGLIGVDLEKSTMLSGKTCQEIRIHLNNTYTQAIAHVFFHYDKKVLALPGFQFSQIG